MKKLLYLIPFAAVFLVAIGLNFHPRLFAGMFLAMWVYSLVVVVMNAKKI